MLLCVPPGPTQYIFHTPMAQYSLYVLKVPLNTNKQTNKQVIAVSQKYVQKMHELQTLAENVFVCDVLRHAVHSGFYENALHVYKFTFTYYLHDSGTWPGRNIR